MSALKELETENKLFCLLFSSITLAVHKSIPKLMNSKIILQGYKSESKSFIYSPKSVVVQSFSV